MEIEKLVTALQEAISLLQSSQSSDWANVSVDEIIHDLELEIDKAGKSQPIDKRQLGFLFAPTGAIQETAIDNDWVEEFLRLSEIVDHFTSEK